MGRELLRLLSLVPLGLTGTSTQLSLGRIEHGTLHSQHAGPAETTSVLLRTLVPLSREGASNGVRRSRGNITSQPG